LSRVRVLLVEGNDDFLDGLTDWLAQNRQLEIVGRAHSGPEAIDLAERLRPDLVLMDVTMPDVSGFDAARKIKSPPDAPVVILMAFHDSHAARIAASAAGADGFVAKSEITERLMPVLRGLIDLETIDHEPARASGNPDPDRKDTTRPAEHPKLQERDPS
jgi:DNA-binding NarL/FixJ family response regulator